MRLTEADWRTLEQGQPICFSLKQQSSEIFETWKAVELEWWSAQFEELPEPVKRITAAQDLIVNVTPSEQESALEWLFFFARYG
ncbi:MAG: hypothetical protein C4337_08950 [Armatimonadota bacterium]